jgi:hypothetical protein
MWAKLKRVLALVLAPMKVPIATALYTLLGVLLAKYWYDGVYWLTVLVLAVALLLAIVVAPLARNFITRYPMAALGMFEGYSWINGLLAAVAACATVLVTVELSALAPEDDPVKELFTQVSAALTTLIGGVVVATKDTDETLGKGIAKEFQGKFTIEGNPKKGKVQLKPDSPSLLAVFTRYANDWTDWSRENRKARISL